MAELTIRLVVDGVTGKKNIVVGYTSEADALPMEHEEDHKRLALAVIAQTGLDPDEIGELIIEREGESAPTSDREAASDSESQQTRRSISEDS